MPCSVDIGVLNVIVGVWVSFWVVELRIDFLFAHREFCLQSLQEAHTDAAGVGSAACSSSMVVSVAFLIFAVGYFFTCVVLRLFLLLCVMFFLFGIIYICSLLHFLPQLCILPFRCWIMSSYFLWVDFTIVAPIFTILGFCLFII